MKITLSSAVVLRKRGDFKKIITDPIYILQEVMFSRSIVGMLLGAIQANGHRHLVNLFHVQNSEGKKKELVWMRKPTRCHFLYSLFLF